MDTTIKQEGNGVDEIIDEIADALIEDAGSYFSVAAQALLRGQLRRDYRKGLSFVESSEKIMSNNLLEEVSHEECDVNQGRN